MTLLQTTRAQALSDRNRQANLDAINQTQPHLQQALANESLDAIEWISARDGALTALLGEEQWLTGCSVPSRAARAMLAKLELKGAVGCFLNPSHAAHIAVALQIIRVEQALIVIVPDMRDLAIMLHCEDFSEAIASHRLWFVAGLNWENELIRLFESQPGLATPSQFIRTPDVDALQFESLMPAAQRIFSQVSSQRVTQLQSLREQFARTSSSKLRLCVVAPSRFRLWNDIGHAMLGVFDNVNDIQVVHFDADDPACSAPLALLKAAQNCTALLTANTSRSDLPGLLPESIPWITWVTTARIPSGALAGCNDHLILVDPALREVAMKMGWSESHIHIGTWSKAKAHGSAVGFKLERHVAMICDTSSLDVPSDLTEYSSHALLWESIRHELLHNPFGLRGIGRFLAEFMTRLNVGDESFPQAKFIEKLILPAYQQGIARELIAAKVPLKLYGQGWEKIDEFRTYAAGTVSSREQFNQAISGASVLLHAWPSNLAHPIDAVAVPVVRCAGKDRQTVLKNLRGILEGRIPAPAVPGTCLDANLIRTIAASV